MSEQQKVTHVPTFWDRVLSYVCKKREVIIPHLNITQQQNTWWGLNPIKQAFIKAMIPDKDEWTLIITKQIEGIWSFSLPEFQTFNESLCNGTEVSLDAHYLQQTGDQAQPGDQMILTAINGDNITLKPNEVTTTLKWLYTDEMDGQSNYYLDTVTNIECWLCPYLQVLFKSAPQTLHMQIKVLQ